MPASPMRRRRSERRLRSGAQQQEEEEWCPAASFAFPESPPLLEPQRSDKMVTTERKLRRQTMMPRQTAAPVASPTLSQRRTRRQSMMPVKVRTSPPGAKVKVTKAKPPALPPVDPVSKAKSKRKLTEEIVTLEESPVSKRRRVAPISKSSTHVKTAAAASPTPAKKHKSASALPVSRSSRKTQTKTASPQAPPESSRKKTPARKRPLSPAKATPSPPKRRATSRSKSESQFVRGRSLTRSQKKRDPAPKSKSSVHIKSPAAGKLDPSPKKKPDKKKPSVASPKLSPKSPGSPARKKGTTATATPKMKTGSKKTASPSTATPSAPPLPKSAKKSVKKPPKSAPKETVHSPPKTPSAGKVKTPTAKSPARKKTPDAKSPAKKKKAPTSAKTPPAKKTSSAKSPPSQKKTPTVVAKKVKTPNSAKKGSLSASKVTSPKSPSALKRRLVRSTAKSHMSEIKTKSLRVVLRGISPPSSVTSFRKTPSSKRAPNGTPPIDLGESPELPSARKQLKRIRDNIAFAHERRQSAGATPRKSLTRSAAKPTLDKVVTQADIHATAADKTDSDGALSNHCDSSPVQASTPSARPPLPTTPKSSRGTSIRVCHFSSRISSSASVQRLSRGSAPHSSTPIKGSAEDNSTVLSDSMDDSVEDRRADTSVESMNGVEDDASLEESVEEQEAEPAAQSRKSYCSLM